MFLVSTLDLSEDSTVQLLSDYFSRLLRSDQFLDATIHPYFLNPLDRTLNDDSTSIIEDPGIRLSIPMIDFDYSINAAAIEKVFDTPASRPSEKSCLVLYRGVGAGKTRTAEELKMRTNEVKDCLTIAITYGGAWLLDESEFTDYVSILYSPSQRKGDKGTYIANVSVVFSVITRITCMVYGKSFGSVKALYRNALSTMPEVSIEQFHFVLGENQLA